MTTVQDTLTYADGGLVNGRVIVSWPVFQFDGVAVAGGQQSWDIVDGVLDVELYSNISAQPIGVYYTATYELDEGPIYEEYWIVPNLPTVNLGQIRAAFPQTPSVMINAQQLTSGGAAYGQFLGWNGSHWVPMYVTTINVSPNTIGLTVTKFAGPDLTVTGSPAVLGNAFTLNVPDAASAARGVVNTAAQSFAGAKTFLGNVTLAQELLFTQYAATGVVWGQAWLSGLSTLSIAASVKLVSADASLATLTAAHLASQHLDLTAGAVAPALPAGPVALGNESILLPNPASAAFVGIGVDAHGNLWQSAGASSFAYLRPDAALVENWTDYSPYQHPTQANVEANRAQSTMVIYSDTSPQWAGVGFDQSMRIWVRLGPDGSGTYYYFSAAEALFPNLSVGNLTVTGTHNIGAALQVSHNNSLIASTNQINFVDYTGPGAVLFLLNYGGSGPVSIQGYIQNDTSTQRVQVDLNQQIIGHRPTINFIPGPNMIVNISDDQNDNQININLDSTGGGPSNTVPSYAVNGALIGQQQELNLIAGLNTNLTGLNNTGLNRVDITIAATGGAANATYYLNSAVVASQPGLNFITGSGIALTAVNNSGSNRVDITIASTAPPNVVTSVFTRVGAVVAQAGDYTVSQVTGACPDPTTTKGDLIVRGTSAVGRLGPVGADGTVLTADSTQSLGVRWAPTAIPATRQIIAGVALSGGGSLAADVTLNVIPMGASGAGHSIGYVPDPGAAAGAARYLCENATWAVPAPVAAYQSPWLTDINAATHMLYSVSQIGIGVAAPLALLNVRKAAAGFNPLTGTQIFVENAGAASYVETACAGVGDSCGYLFSSGGSLTSYIIDLNSNWSFVSAARPVLFNLGGAERMRITTAGPVGIGNTAPAFVGGLPPEILVIGNSISGSTDFGTLALSCNNTAAGAAGHFDFVNYAISATDKRLAIIAGSVDTAPNSGNLTFYTYNAGAIGERMRITPAGNVGIGTSTPNAPLQVTGSASAPLNGLFVTTNAFTFVSAGTLVRIGTGAASGNTYGEIDALVSGGSAYGNLVLNSGGGNVGIGTTAPTSALTVASPATAWNSATGQLQVIDTAVPGRQIRMGYDPTLEAGWIQASKAGVAFESLLLNPNSGNVGIGTTAPLLPLRVYAAAGGMPPTSGTAPTGILYIDSSSGGNGLYFGVQASSPNGAWIQVSDRNTFAATYPLLLQPNGGNVGIGVSVANNQLSLGGYGAIGANTGNSSGYLVHQYLGTNSMDCLSLACNYIRSDSNAGFVAAGSIGTTEVQLLAGGVPPYSQINFLTGNIGGAPILRMSISNSGIVNCTGVLNVGAGNASTQGDLAVARPSSPGTGVVYFGNSGNSYLFYDGTNFNFAGGLVNMPSLQVGASGSILSNLTVSGIIYGGSATLNVPAHNCPVYTTNPNMPNNTYGFTVNESGNYATFWVRFSNGTLHIFSTTLTTAP